MLAQRSIMEHIRSTGEITGGPPPFGPKDRSRYLQALDDSQTCRVTTKVMPMGLPIFCMFRAELHQALRQRGFRIKDEDLRLWQDIFAPGDPAVPLRSVHFAQGQLSKSLLVRALAADAQFRCNLILRQPCHIV